MSNQSIFEQAKQQLDRDFGSVAPPIETTEPADVFCQRYTEHHGEAHDWLRDMPTPVADTKIVAFSRVSKTLSYSGSRIFRTTPQEIPNGVDADVHIQTYIDECGLCAEGYNSAGEVVRKYTTNSETLNFI